MAQVPYKRLEFARQPGDYLVSGRVQLDQGGPTYRMVLQHHPLMGERLPLGRWVFTMSTTTNLVIVSGAGVRDRTSVLLGVASLGRPRGDIVSYDPKKRGDPWAADAFADDGDGVEIRYYQNGYDPNNFALYTTRLT